MLKLIVEYDPTTDYGEHLADGRAEYYVDGLIENVNRNFKDKPIVRLTTSELFIYAIQLAVLDGKIGYNEVKFRYEGIDLVMNEYAEIQDWPEGFCDYGARMAQNIMKKIVEKRKQKNG